MNTEIINGKRDLNCVFCKMVAGDIKPMIVYEDDDVLAFLDNNPLSIGHTLVIPKVHTSDIFAIDEKLFGTVMERAHKVAAGIERGLKADGINVLINNRPEGGQEILHLHVHLIPRYKAVQMKYGTHVQYKEGEKENTKNLILEALN